jgi:hypothetical protein
METIINNLLMEYKMSSPDEMILKMAKSLHRAHMSYDKIKNKKKARSIKIIPYQHDNVTVKTKTTCQATMLSGKRCSNPAVCNGLCKRHQIDL